PASVRVRPLLRHLASELGPAALLARCAGQGAGRSEGHAGGWDHRGGGRRGRAERAGPAGRGAPHHQPLPRARQRQDGALGVLQQVPQAAGRGGLRRLRHHRGADPPRQRRFFAGDSHASQGDSELRGTAIECPLTGTFQLVLHEKATLAGTALEARSYPLLETQDEWVLRGFSYANYLAELGADAQSKIYEKSSVDLAMKDASRKTRHFLMTTNDHEGPARRRRDLPDVGGGGLRHHPGGRRQLRRARHREEEPVRGERLTPDRKSARR